MKAEDIIDVDYLNELADSIWEGECATGGDAGTATDRMIDLVGDDLASYIPLECEDREKWLVLIDMLAGQIVKYWIKNFEEYEEESHEDTALQEAERSIREETMHNL